MTASSHPEPHPIRPLAPSGRRALAAFGLTTLTGLPLVTASTVVDLLDAVSWAVLGGAGASPVEARGILAGLWEQDDGPNDPTASTGTLPELDR